MKMPSIFVGHGSPMLALEQNGYTEQWKQLGQRFRPKGILAISGHWVTSGNRIQDEERPRKINDMYGFPRELYRLEYPVKGDKALTEEVLKILGTEVQVDNDWGIDHGTWAVLNHMYPKCDIPVVQLSVDQNKTPQEHYLLGKKLTALRELGYMILGSGNVVHNLRYIDPSAMEPLPWAKAFDDYIENAIRENDDNRCINYLNFGESARLSAPTPDHFEPLLVFLGTRGEGDSLTVFNKGYDMGSLSMTGYLFE